MINDTDLRYATDKIKEEYGEEIAEKVGHGWGVKRFTTLRANGLKTTADKVAAELSAAGIAFEPISWYQDAFLLKESDEKVICSLPLYENGEIYLQSLSSMLPPIILQPQAGQTVLDMAAAPGGKTTQMAAMTNGRAQITACEVHPARAEKLRFNLQKQGAGRVSVLTQDARNMSDFFSFDRILLDAPCSGSGTICLHDPFSKAAYNDKLLAKITSTQLALLKKALTLLKKGQSMVYSTCSLFREENERVVQAAVKGGGFEIMPIDKTPFNDVTFLPSTLDGVLTVCPDERYEGFFIAKIYKK